MKTPCPDFTGHWNPSLSGQAEKTLPESGMELEIPHKEPPHPGPHHPDTWLVCSHDPGGLYPGQNRGGS